MDPKTGWASNQTVCRCCLAEGCYKDISTEYFWMGKREVYSEMLSDTFDISISFPTVSSTTTSRLICEPCISRLRDASEFKKQVQDCEKTFVQHLDTVETGIELDVREPDPIPLMEPVLKVVKIEQVKMEKAESDDEYVPSADDMDDDHLNDDDDDDLDDEPLTKLASKRTKTPKTEPEPEPKASKRKITIKLKEPAKKPKVAAKIVSKAKPKPTTSKVLAKPQSDKKSKAWVKVNAAKWNAEIIMKFTTAYPFRMPGEAILCVYCSSDSNKEFTDPTLFREHMRTEHTKFNRNVVFAHVNCDNFLKLDCTELTCQICKLPFSRLMDIAHHLKDVHRARLRLETGLDLLPYVMFRDRLACGVCDANQPGMRQLGRHLATHFAKFTCEICARPYVNVTSLKKHVLTCNKEEYVCRKCNKSFKNISDRSKHVSENKRCWPYRCEQCMERFEKWRTKQTHMVEAHGMPSRSYTCRECGEVFYKYDHYKTHFRINHSDQSYECTYCFKKWGSKRALQRHLITHTKEKPFICEVCSKAFGTKTQLTQHSWIHKEEKRFQCIPCDKKFNQRISWRMHMKSRHPEAGIS